MHLYLYKWQDNNYNNIILIEISTQHYYTLDAAEVNILTTI